MLGRELASLPLCANVVWTGLVTHLLNLEKLMIGTPAPFVTAFIEGGVDVTGQLTSIF